MPPDEPTREEKLEKEAQDGQTPFRPADDTSSPVVAATDDDTALLVDDSIASDNTGGIEDTHPETDTNLQAEEWYDEGIAGAAEAGEPNVDNTVIGYEKPKNKV